VPHPGTQAHVLSSFKQTRLLPTLHAASEPPQPDAQSTVTKQKTNTRTKTLIGLALVPTFSKLFTILNAPMNLSDSTS
jgi:hypothetical protein